MKVLNSRQLAACCAASCALIAATAGADTYPRQPGVDALHYVFKLALDDGSDAISGEATARFRIVSASKEVFLDLVSASAGKGMTVKDVSVEGQPVSFTHKADRLQIPLPADRGAGSDVTITVRYAGVAAEGLRIINNVHGERTMFSENWPNRARHWLPMIDHPYDKATGEFVVTAPSQYQVVSNGLLVEELDLPKGFRRTHWKQSVPIASWLYALGVSRFAVHHYDVVRGIPQQVWVFPQDRDKAYDLFELTGRRAFEFFSDTIGPYPYEKLGHVQAAGLNGGTEHASAIFYGEKGVAGGRAPIVHEVAHQWWGNAVTEKDWDDVWLSEGFATYFTHLYTEQFEGRDAFVRGLRNDVAVVADAQRNAPDQPVIHRNISDMNGVLNRLVYQKAGWVLHMLRGIVGTARFHDGIREYLPPLSQPERVDRRLPAGHGAGLRDGAVVVLRPVAQTRRDAATPGILALRCERETGRDRPRASAVGAGVPAAGGNRDHDRQGTCASRTDRAGAGERTVRHPRRWRAPIRDARSEHLGADGGTGIHQTAVKEMQ